MNAVQKIRRENQKIRPLELALTNAATAAEAAAALHKVFAREFDDNKERTNVRPSKHSG
jgi:heme O synthase-like polyprenyltransferase